MNEIDLDTYGGENYFYHLFIIWAAIGGCLMALCMIDHGITPKAILTMVAGVLP